MHSFVRSSIRSFTHPRVSPDNRPAVRRTAEMASVQAIALRPTTIPMKLVAVAALKGGTGRTTATMVIASALDHLGRRIVLFDTDPLEPLLQWQAAARKAGTWSDRCVAVATPDLGSVDRAYATAQTENEPDNVDLVLIDLNMRDERITRVVVPNAAMVLISTGLTSLDVAAATAAYQQVVELLLEAEAPVETALLFPRIPDRELMPVERAGQDALVTLPHMQTMLAERDPFAAMPNRGLLHRLPVTDLRRALQHRISPINSARTETEALATELLQRIDA